VSPIIDLQRRMVEAGRLRAGDRSDKGAPRKLKNWRMTSKDELRLNYAAKLWGGSVQKWEEQWELYTETDTLPIMLLPGHAPTTWYELWSKGGCQRRCDGQHEIMSDSTCLCLDDERECKPYTRLSVLLPDLPGIGSWLVTSTGWNAAAELAGAADLLQRASAQGVLLPARLRLEQRTEIKSGQTRHFAVPVLDVDVSFRELLAGSALSDPPRSLPAGYTPIEHSVKVNGGSLAEGLADVQRQELTRTSRSAVAIPEDDDVLDQDAGEPSVGHEADVPPTSSDASSSSDDESPAKPLTLAQAKKKLDALVGQLRDGGHITTQQLWARMSKLRNVDVDEMVVLLEGIREDEQLHWSPLRDSLDRKEANELRDRLGKLWASVQDDGA